MYYEISFGSLDPECSYSLIYFLIITILITHHLSLSIKVMSVRGQVLCRATFNCTGGIADYLGVAVDGAGCCIGNPDALAYSPIGTCQEDCIACVGEF